ncbi:Protein TIME FOR COFFEE [Hordeum vulgare]|nr:Protein TIME FOR COFFEE [Hordeum vulgare]
MKTKTLIVTQEAHDRVMSNLLRNHVDRNIAFCRISELKQSNTLNPRLGRPNMQPLVKKKSNNFLSYLNHIISRWCWVDVSDDKALMTSGDGDRGRGVDPRQPVGSSIYDIVARREEELGIKLKNFMYPSSTSQGGVPGQSPQLKASSMRVSAPSSVASVPVASSPSNLIMMKNNGLHQQQEKAQQALPILNHQSQSMSSSKIGHSLTNLSTGGGGDLSRSSNAPVASGSPSNSVSKSIGGSPPASGSAKGGQSVVQLSSPQQHAAKNSPSTSGSKSASTNHYSSMPMPSILGQQSNMAHSGGPPQHVNAGVGVVLYQKRSTDKTRQQQQQNVVPGSSAMLSLGSMSMSTAAIPANPGKAAGSNMKANLHPVAGDYPD